MIKSFLKLAYRSVLASKAYAAINVVGLAVGLACALLILIWVDYETSVDAWHKNGERIFQVYERQYYDHKVEGVRSTPGELGSELKRLIPEVEYSTAMLHDQWHTFQSGEKILSIKGGYAGADYFKMFNIPVLQGDPQTAMSDLSGIVISRKMSEQFFGSPQAAIGKNIRVDNKTNFTIKAVFEDLPDNTSIKFDYLINWAEMLEEHPWLRQWDSQYPETYVVLQSTANPKLVESKIKHFLDNYIKDQPQGHVKTELGLQRYDEVYLHGHFTDGKISGGRIDYLRLFSLIAVFIIVIASINFTNLATARSVKRGREIGVRKVLGAGRVSLVIQFISEAILTTVIAVVVSLLFLLLILPVFNGIVQKEIVIPFNESSFWIKLLVVTLITGTVAGCYPALFLSSVRPVKVLKGVEKLGKGSSLFRKSLVIFQFVISIILIIGTIVIARQISYIQSKDLGYDRDNLIYLPLSGQLRTKYALFKEMLPNMPGVQSITHASEAVTDIENDESDVQWAGKAAGIKSSFTIMTAGYDFVTTMKLKLKAGRDHSKNYPTDSTGFVINETALKEIEYVDPLGKTITVWGKTGPIIGVIRDFHFTSMHDPIKPLIICFGEHESSGAALIRVQPGHVLQALTSVEKVVKDINPHFPFNYTFSDEEFSRLYQGEIVIGKLSRSFSFLAIFITCLGLLGQVMFITEQRSKEISVRKILGASVSSIFRLLTGEFVVLIIISLLIATPIAYFAMDKWLQNFAYHTSIQWWFFVIAALVALAITFITISVQSLRAARMNPVENLRK